MASTQQMQPSLDEQREAAMKKENKQVEEAQKAGVAAFSFDPNASPEEKAAQAKKAIPTSLKLSKPDLSNGGPATGKSLNGSTAAATPTSPKGQVIGPNGEKYVNGYPKAGDGEWDRIGWEPRFGTLNEALEVDKFKEKAEHQTWVEQNLDDKFYGDWYHNAGVIVFSCLATWLVTKLGLGLAWVIMVMACCGTYYRTSIKRVRRNVRDDLNREFAKARLANDVESLEWINSFTVKFWPIYAPVISATVINSVDQVLATATPAFLDSLRLATFNLGSKPPRIDFVKTYPKTEDDIVEMDWAFSFTPNDTADLTSRQIKNKINPKVVLEVRVGKGIVSKGIPIVVEDMSFSGTMKVKIKLQINFPHIEKVDVCFLAPPTFDFVLKPVGGETFGIDIGFLPGLMGFIQDQVHANLGPMFYAPNVFTVEVAKMLGGAPIDAAIGVLAVTIHNAHGLKNPDKFSGTPDPYAIVSINDRVELARTKTIHESDNPKWNETKYIIINNFNDALTIPVYDYNDIRKDKRLGMATFPLDQLENDHEHENKQLPVVSGGKDRGQVICDFRFFPVLTPRKLEDGTEEPVPEMNTGIVRFTISQCKELDANKSLIGQLSPYAVPILNDKPLTHTKIQKRTNNPIWEESREFLVTNRKTCKLGVKIMDDRGLQADPVVGEYKIKLEDLLEANRKGSDWFNLAGAKTGRVKMTAQWKPVEIKGALGGSGGYVTPIGVMRLHFQNARNLRNLEAIGKSDPYLRVMLSGIEKAKTVTFYNDLNPDWDEVLYVPVHSNKEKLMFEVMDQEKMGKDRLLGHCELKTEDYVFQDENGLYKEHSEKKPIAAALIYGKGAVKGTLNYTAAFYPCLNVADPEDEEEEKQAKALQDEIQNQDAKPAENGKQEVVDVQAEQPDDQGKAVDSADLEKDLAATETRKSSVSEAPKKVRLTPEDLVKYDSGLLIFKIIEGSFSSKDTHLEVVMDDMLFPSYRSGKIKTRTMKLEDIGDAVVRELEFSKVTLRLRKDDADEDDDDVVAKLTGNTLDTLKQCLNNPTVLTLRGKDGETSKVKISLKYIPILMTLDPSESINNMGTLRVDVLDGSDLPSADRNGKSDPFCTFELNGEKVHKTEVQKKTLHPAWNEFFECKVPSRTAADFKVTVYDWDFAGDPDFLGTAPIDLAALDPFKPSPVVLKLRGKKGQAGNFGELRLRLLFKADYVTRSRQGSSTFSGTFAVPGKIISTGAAVPLKGVGLVAGGIQKGGSFVAKGLFGAGKKKESTSNDITEEAEMEEVSKAVAAGGGIKASSKGEMTTVDSANRESTPLDATAERHLEPAGSPSKRRSLTPSGFGSPHGRSKSITSNYGGSSSPTSGESGTAKIRVISATGYPATANLQFRIKYAGKSKEIYKSKGIKGGGNIEWNEEYSVACTADQQFVIRILDDHLIRTDETFGETMFVLDDTGAGGDLVLQCGEGKVTLKATFVPSDQGSSSGKKKGLFKSK